MNKQGSLDSLVVNTAGSLNSPVEYNGSLNSPVMNSPGGRLLVLFGKASEQVYKKNILVTKRPGSKDSPGY
jgi:hypothetical protein